MREPTYRVDIHQGKQALKVDNKMVEQLKKTLSNKLITRMRREYVICPVARQEIPFLLCYNCVSFIRRVQGIVDCEGKEYRVKTIGE